MTSSSCGSHPSTPLRLIKSSTIWPLWLTITTCLLATCSLAQQIRLEALPDAPSVAQASSPPEQNPGPDQMRVTIPAGTRLRLVLTHAMDSNRTRGGDEIFAQTTAPVILNDQVVIPAGTYVRGKVQKLGRKGTQAEMLMQSASLVFSNGYIADVGGSVNIESEPWTAWDNPTGGRKAAIILVPMITLPVGALIGSAADGKQTSAFNGVTISTPTHTGLVIGTTVGFVAGLATSFGLMAHSRQFYIDAGSALSMKLPQPITLTQAQINQAIGRAAGEPAPFPVVPKRPPPSVTPVSTDHGICYTPGSPGTPDIVIPGTPSIGNSPGTPPTLIPGVPATPPIPQPCP